MNANEKPVISTERKAHESPVRMKTNSRKPKRPTEAKTSRTAQRKGDSRAAHGSEVPTPRTTKLRRELYWLKSNTIEYPCEVQLTELCRQLERELLEVGAALDKENERWGLYGNDSQAALRAFKERNPSAGLPNEKADARRVEPPKEQR